MSAAGTRNDEAVFELRFAPTVALASIVRRFVTEFYLELLDDFDVSHRFVPAERRLRSA
jgi:hypothetical protein